MKAALAMERSRLTIVETAMTGSGSVAWRMPRKKPIARMANPLVMVFARLKSLHLQHTGEWVDAHASRGCRSGLFAVAQNAHEFGGRMREARASARDKVDVAGAALPPPPPLFHPAMLAFPPLAHARERYRAPL